MPVFSNTENYWGKEPDWNWAHLISVDGKILCRPGQVVMPLPERASDNDKRCDNCASVSGPSAL